MYGRRIIFHENGREYSWYPASHDVWDSHWRKVSDRCYNMDEARAAVKKRG